MTETIRQQSPGSILRPVQYLGSKLRALDSIQNEVAKRIPHGSTIWEPFSGSTVVAQGLAAQGYRVAATDALTSSAIFAQALLGVGRTDPEDVSVDQMLTRIEEAAPSDAIPDYWLPWVQNERNALAARDGRKLLEVSERIPQRWQPRNTDSDLSRLFDSVDTAAASKLTAYDGLISSTYAGTYFGIYQAIRIEQLRRAFDRLRVQGVLSSWCHAVCLTALCGAASSASYSAGKHFAQPHRIRADKDLTFHVQRIVSDRGVDIDRAFRQGLRKITSAARPGAERHTAQVLRTEQTSGDTLEAWNVAAVYADPPYTAQQYSRFYHVLDVLSEATPANLQTVKGRVTRGLYPDNKYLSPFCSRKQAPAAFAHLTNVVRRAGASLFLSYSASTHGATGNARTVSLDSLAEMLRDVYGPRNTHIQKLDVRYRQFNNGRTGVVARDDPEYLLIGEM